MLGFSENLPLEFEAAHVLHSDISWIAVNSHKPGRSDRFTLMVHSSEEYSEAHIDDDRETVMQHLMNETSNVIGHDVSIADYKTVHGWRYANNAKRENYHIFLDPDSKLAACGDWCLGGRVEGAFTSAYNLVNAMKEVVKM
jgi:predicted NAD/FAD-dependent oxidoreductase